MRSLKLILLLILFHDREVWGATSDLCAENERVVSNQCKKCPDSYANEAGDNRTGSDTLCRKCAVNHYVDSNVCKACPPGTENEVQDIVSGGDTTYKAILCKANEYVSFHTCISCPPGYNNAANDNASDDDTECGECAENYYVSADD